MSEIEKQAQPIASARMIFDKQRGASNPVTNIAFADLLLLKEQL